jgi:hypothetical protein
LEDVQHQPHDEQIFPNSHDFQPERFIDTDGKVYNQDKVLTFSLGKFICINIMISIWAESRGYLEIFVHHALQNQDTEI